MSGGACWCNVWISPCCAVIMISYLYQEQWRFERIFYSMNSWFLYTERINGFEHCDAQKRNVSQIQEGHFLNILIHNIHILELNYRHYQ